MLAMNREIYDTQKSANSFPDRQRNEISYHNIPDSQIFDFSKLDFFSIFLHWIIIFELYFDFPSWSAILIQSKKQTECSNLSQYSKFCPLYTFRMHQRFFEISQLFFLNATFPQKNWGLCFLLNDFGIKSLPSGFKLYIFL